MEDEPITVGRNTVVEAEDYRLAQMFDRRFTRPERTGGTWYGVGPFGNGGQGRLRGEAHVKPDPEYSPIDGYGWESKRRKPGTGTVRRLKGRWQAILPKVNGKQRYLSSHATREEAEAALDAWLEGRESNG